MPVTHHYDARARVLIVRLLGEVTDDDVLQYAREATESPVADPRHHELIDCREVEVPAARTQTLRRVARMFQEAERAPSGVKIAFVTTSDAAYGLARMYQALRDLSPVEIRVFREMVEARAWLGLPPERNDAAR